MPYPSGQLPASALTTVQAGIQIATPTARAWKRLQAAAKRQLRRTITIARPAGGYRSAAVQDAMHAAGVGHDSAAKARWGLSLASTVQIAVHPFGKHEDGRRVDVLGTPMDAAFLDLARKYGFTREFGAADPNHFRHDGHTATAPVTPAAVLPAKRQQMYQVKPGDTLAAIARNYSDPRDKKADTTVDDLLRLNPAIHNRNLIRVGQKIRVA